MTVLFGLLLSYYCWLNLVIVMFGLFGDCDLFNGVAYSVSFGGLQLLFAFIVWF